MKKTLKTYPDGSELTTTMVAVAIIGTAAVMTITTVITVKLYEREQIREAKKLGIDPNKM